MLNDNQLLILLGAALALIVLAKILEGRSNRTADASSRALKSIKARLIIFGILAAGLLIALPWSIDFRMLEYPEDFKSLDEVHAYLKQQGKMLERVSQIIHAFLFFFIVFFLSDLYRSAKSILIANASDQEPR